MPGSLLAREWRMWRLTGAAAWLGLALVPASIVGRVLGVLGGPALALGLVLAVILVVGAARVRRALLRCPRCHTHLLDFTDVYPMSFEARPRLIALEQCPRCTRSLVRIEEGLAEDRLRH